jgi:signal transduction histidine kinase
LCGVLAVALLVDQAARVLIYRPLAHIRSTLQRAAAGQRDARVSIARLDEIGVVGRSLNDILHGLEQLNEAVDVRVAVATEAFRQKSVEIADSHRERAVLSEELARAGRLAALGQAAANMAHQIGTPLNLISGYVQLLIQSSPTDTATLERLKSIQEQANKVTAVVRAALDTSRPATGRHERCDLGELVRRVCHMAAPLLERAGVTVDVISPTPPADILADTLQLELALLNLVSNSVDAMPAGGQLTVRLSQEEDRFRLDVEDTGAGIHPAVVEHLFEPWVTTKPPGKGSGLGLSIARQVIVSHGGGIRVENRPGGGAVFTITLPAAQPADPRQDIVHAENSRR